MVSSAIPEDLAAFVRASIKSGLDFSNCYCFSFVTEKMAWSVDQLNRELRSSAPLVANILASLQTSGLVIEPTADAFCFQPANAELEALVARLERLYAEKPLAVRTEIVTAQGQKIQGFADAFRFKKD